MSPSRYLLSCLRAQGDSSEGLFSAVFVLDTYVKGAARFTQTMFVCSLIPLAICLSPDSRLWSAPLRRSVHFIFYPSHDSSVFEPLFVSFSLVSPPPIQPNSAALKPCCSQSMDGSAQAWMCPSGYLRNH